MQYNNLQTSIHLLYNKISSSSSSSSSKLHANLFFFSPPLFPSTLPCVLSTVLSITNTFSGRVISMETHHPKASVVSSTILPILVSRRELRLSKQEKYALRSSGESLLYMLRVFFHSISRILCSVPCMRPVTSASTSMHIYRKETAGTSKLIKFSYWVDDDVTFYLGLEKFGVDFRYLDCPVKPKQ